MVIPINVRDHIPLEQGLRLILLNIIVAQYMSQRPYSIRTRIKTIFPMNVDGVDCGVRDHIPLEQGLRPGGTNTIVDFLACQRPYSIRTRIKTANDTTVRISFIRSETIFH